MFVDDLYQQGALKVMYSDESLLSKQIATN